MPELNLYWIQTIAIGVLLGQLAWIIVGFLLYNLGSQLYWRWIHWRARTRENG